MMRAWVALGIGIFALAIPARADTFELKERKIRIDKKNADIFPQVELRPQEALPGVTAEPRYRSDMPRRFAARFGRGGERVVSFAVDERRGAGEGFDLLLVDVRGTGDLNEARKLGGKPESRGVSYEDTEFPPFEIEIPATDGVTGYPVQARFSNRKVEPPDASLYLTSLCALEGDVTFGEKKQRIVVFDSNCNGVFGERGSPSTDGALQTGDKIWIGSGSSRLEDAYVESLPLGRYTLFDGEYFEISFPGQRSVDIVKAEVPLGRIKVSNPGFLLELVGKDGVLYVGNPDGDEIDVPVGSYRVHTPGFRRKWHGAVWELEGQPGAASEEFTVQEGTMATLEVGPPLKLVISAVLQPAGNGVVASFDFRIDGNKGERYRFLRKNGKKVDLPEISIRNSANKEVKSGSFEYG